MKYPKSYIEEISNRLKVSDVVRLKVNLKKTLALIMKKSYTRQETKLNSYHDNI